MACESSTWFVLLLLLVAAICKQHCVNGASQVPCLFIFGDSLSDSGNNNNLATAVKSNFKPYGIDFPYGPTGRFTNGRTAVDIITQLLEFEDFIPPFSNTTGSDILKGVNYASGAAGILVESATHSGAVISLGLQMANHRVIVSQIATILGSLQKAQQHLNKCLYYVNIGSNDYMNNYFQPQFYPTSRIYSPELYAEILLAELYLNLVDLYVVGARKFVLVGLGLLGCTPNAICTHGTSGSCFDEENAATFIFNNKLKSLVDFFNSKLSADSKFIFINSTAVALAYSNAPGLKVSHAACCPTGVSGACIPDQRVCYNRREYLFWDDFHPTEAWNLINAINSYDASQPAFAYPVDIKRLVDREIKMELELTNEFTTQAVPLNKFRLSCSGSYGAK